MKLYFLILCFFLLNFELIAEDKFELSVMRFKIEDLKKNESSIEKLKVFLSKNEQFKNLIVVEKPKDEIFYINIIGFEDYKLCNQLKEELVKGFPVFENCYVYKAEGIANKTAENIKAIKFEDMVLPKFVQISLKGGGKVLYDEISQNSDLKDGLTNIHFDENEDTIIFTCAVYEQNGKKYLKILQIIGGVIEKYDRFELTLNISIQKKDIKNKDMNPIESK